MISHRVQVHLERELQMRIEECRESASHPKSIFENHPHPTLKRDLSLTVT